MTNPKIQNLFYDKREYWNERYRKQGANALKDKISFCQMEWYIDWADSTWLQSLLKANGLLTNKNQIILIVGCGDSKVGAALREDKFLAVEEVDFSQVCLENLKKEDRSSSGIAADVTRIAFRSNIVDLVFDKGTLDAVSVEEDKQREMIQEVYRVLRPGGCYIVVTMFPPSIMRGLFESEFLRVEHGVVPYSYQSLFIRCLKQLRNCRPPGEESKVLRFLAMWKAQQLLEKAKDIHLSWNKSSDTRLVDEEMEKMPSESIVCHVFMCFKEE